MAKPPANVPMALPKFANITTSNILRDVVLPETAQMSDIVRKVFKITYLRFS